VARLRPVIQTKGSTTGFASEREEIELVAVGVLAVRSKQCRVFLVHLGEACLLLRI
jgi:hypothetical protein